MFAEPSSPFITNHFNNYDMKKFYTALFLLLATVPALAQMVSDEHKSEEGAIKSFSAKHLKINFSDGKVHFTQNGTTESFALTNFGSLQFTVLPTGIAPIQQRALWEVQGQEVLVNAPVGTVSALYSLNGQLVATHVQRNAQFETLGSVPASGLYVLRVKDKSTKIFVR